jgi:Flavin containing amine oxidoreductase
VLAIPGEKLWPLLDDAVIAAVPTLARSRYLRSTPMAALNLYLARPLASLPRGHVNLIGSAYGLSFIDVARYWPGAPCAALEGIASDFTPLLSASAEFAERNILEELRRCAPELREAEVVWAIFLPHLDEPLFMNDVGAWTYRPGARTELPNLYLAGDYCRSAIDLVSMEGAVSTGLLAAEAVRADAGLSSAVEILVPETPPRWLLVTDRITLAPLALLAKPWASLSRPADHPDAVIGQQRPARRGCDEPRTGGEKNG